MNAGQPKILHVAASPKGPASHSWQTADVLLQRLGGEVLTRRFDLHAPPPPNGAFAADMMTAQTPSEAAARPSLAISEILIRDLETTDVLVISTPMHNFTLPASLKAWIDQVVRFGRTFQSTPDGKIGLLADRPTYVVIASGGAISPPDARQPDFLRPYLTAILDCIGIRDVTFITAEAMSRGEEAVAKGRADALAQIDAAFAGTAGAA